MQLNFSRVGLWLWTGLGKTRGFYCNSNSDGSELQGIGEFYWKELIRSLKVQKRIGKIYFWELAMK